jgi:hypothetical protein
MTGIRRWRLYLAAGATAALSSVGLATATVATAAPQFIATADCQEHQAFVDGDEQAVAARLPKAYTPVRDGASGPPLLFVRGLKCQRVTLDGRTAPATMASFGVVVESPDGRGCASGAPAAGGVKGDVPPVCNWYTLFWLSSDKRIVRWLRDRTPGFPAVYVPKLRFELGAVDPAQGGAPFHLDAPSPSPSPFAVDEIARERPGELSVRGGYWADTPQGTVKLAFSTEDLTSGDATGTVHAQPGSEMASLLGANERSYATAYSSLSAERWAHASYRKQLLSPAESTHSFAGSCSLQGDVAFSPPATNTPTPLTYDYHGTGTCTGTLDGRALSDGAVTVRQSGPADGSCPRAVTTSPGSGAMTFADGTTIPYTLDFSFVGTEGTIWLYGERSGTATGHGTLLTQRTPPAGALQCGSGIATTPLDITFSTESPLTSDPPLRPCQTTPCTMPPGPDRRIRLSVSPRTVRAGARTAFAFRVTGTDRRPVSGAVVRFAGRRARVGDAGRTTIVTTIHRPGRRVARAIKPGFRPARAAVRVRHRSPTRPTFAG